MVDAHVNSRIMLTKQVWCPLGISLVGVHVNSRMLAKQIWHPLCIFLLGANKFSNFKFILDWTTKWVVKVYNVEELCGSYYSSWRWTIVVFLQLFYLGDKLLTIYIHIFYLSRICFASILEFTWTSTREIPKGHHTCFVVSIILEFTWAPTRKIPEGHFDLEGILFWPLFCFIFGQFLTLNETLNPNFSINMGFLDC